MLSRRAYRNWFLAAAIYNFVWGAWTALFPNAYFHLVRVEPPTYPGLWQCIGMIVFVYGAGYYLVSRQPERYAAVAAVGLMGKVLGPVGFVVSAMAGLIPWRFGWILLVNDLLWWPVFATFLLKYGRRPFDSCAAAVEQGNDHIP